MDNEERSHDQSRTAVLEAAVFGPLERATAQGTDPLTLLDTEEALRLIRAPNTLLDLLAAR
jgi:hypothetical protein